MQQFSCTCRIKLNFPLGYIILQIVNGNGILKHFRHQSASQEAIKRCCFTQITAVELQQLKAHSPLHQGENTIGRLT